MAIKIGDVVLCRFYFSDFKQSKNRPVLVLKDNLPFNDFIAIPISSKIENLHKDEFLIEQKDFLSGNIPTTSKIILRKTFVASKSVVVKEYGHLTKTKLNELKLKFCEYFEC